MLSTGPEAIIHMQAASMSSGQAQATCDLSLEAGRPGWRAG